MRGSSNLADRSLAKKMAATLFICSVLAVPLSLLSLSVFDLIFDPQLKSIDLSRFDAEAYWSDAIAALWPTENPHKVFYRLFAGALVGVAFSVGFSLAGAHTYRLPLFLGFLFTGVVVVAFLISQGADAAQGGADLEWLLIFLTFATPSFVLWLVLRPIWKRQA